MLVSNWCPTIVFAFLVCSYQAEKANMPTCERHPPSCRCELLSAEKAEGGQLPLAPACLLHTSRAVHHVLCCTATCVPFNIPCGQPPQPVLWEDQGCVTRGNFVHMHGATRCVSLRLELLSAKPMAEGRQM